MLAQAACYFTIDKYSYSPFEELDLSHLSFQAPSSHIPIRDFPRGAELKAYAQAASQSARHKYPCRRKSR
jgi:hypothetical protein